MKMTAAVLYEQGLPHPFTVSKPMRRNVPVAVEIGEQASIASGR